ncbi:hypothetical protein M3Y95_01107600 [Aphelenchoides besseyi]|nr:hypothetical protein M3Y95_01107600 [Aphelenchoides besseyi]
MDFSPPAPQLQDVAFYRSQGPKTQTRPIQRPPECIPSQPLELNGSDERKKWLTIRLLLLMLVLFLLALFAFIGVCVGTNHVIDIEHNQQSFDIAVSACSLMAAMCLFLAILLYVKIRAECRRRQEQKVVYSSNPLNL